MAHLSPAPRLNPVRTATMILNMGPHHPRLNGVLRLLLEIDGENIVRIMPTSGICTPG